MLTLCNILMSHHDFFRQKLEPASHHCCKVQCTWEVLIPLYCRKFGGHVHVLCIIVNIYAKRKLRRSAALIGENIITLVFLLSANDCIVDMTIFTALAKILLWYMAQETFLYRSTFVLYICISYERLVARPTNKCWC